MFKKTIIFFFLISNSIHFCAQENIKNDFLQFGISNVGGLIHSALKSDSTSSIQYFMQYHENIDTLTFTRFGVSSSFKTEKLGIRYFDFIPLNIFVGIEKQIIKNRTIFTYGIDVFYSMSLRGSTLGNGSWRGDDFGVGLSPMSGLAYTINNQWRIGTEVSIGGGLFRIYKNAGTTTAKVLTPRWLFLKTISFGLAYRLKSKT